MIVGEKIPHHISMLNRVILLSMVALTLILLPVAFALQSMGILSLDHD